MALRTARRARPLPNELQVGTLLARAQIAPATFDADALEVDVCLGSGQAVVRAPWFDEPYIEELSMDPAHVRMVRLNSGRMAVLDSHNQWNLRAQIGVVVRGWAEGGRLMARVRFSRRDELAGLVRDIQEGIIGNLSIGYRVHAMQDATLPTDNMRRLRAVDWEPLEASFVTVPADSDSEVRGVAGLNSTSPNGAVMTRAEDGWTPCKVIGLAAGETNMDPEVLQAQEATRAAAAATTPATPVPAASQPAPASTPAVDQAAEVRAARERETHRCSEVVRLASAHQLPAEWTQRMLGDPRMDIAAIQRSALDSLATRSDAGAPTSHVRVLADQCDKVRAAVRSVLDFRFGLTPTVTAEARPIQHQRITRLAEEFFRGYGVDTRVLSPTEFASLALKGSTGSINDPTRGLMASGDFALLLADSQGKAMRKAYEAQPATWQLIARPTTANDFKPLSRIQLSGGTGLKRVNEAGEFERGSFNETAETYGLNTEGVIYGFTRKAFINDDLGELQRVTKKMGVRAMDRRSELVWALVTGNPNLADGSAWFHAANHFNLATGAPSALSETSLAVMLAAMRTQKDSNGNLIQVVPKFLFVPAALEIAAKKLTTSISPNISSSVNPFQGMFAGVIVEGRLDANSSTAWYGFADPDAIDVIEYAELAGQSGPQIMIRNGFDVDGIEFRIHEDFGCAPLEYASAYKSAGA